VRVRVVLVAAVLAGCGERTAASTTEYDPPGPSGPYPRVVDFERAERVEITVGGVRVSAKLSSHCWTSAEGGGVCADYAAPANRTDLGAPADATIDVRTGERAMKVSTAVSTTGMRDGVRAARVDRAGRHWRARVPHRARGTNFLVVRVRYTAIDREYKETGGSIPFVAAVRIR
jgi:hypothetical protein